MQVSDRELEDKFRHNASGVLPEEKADNAVKFIWELEELKDISYLMDALAG